MVLPSWIILVPLLLVIGITYPMVEKQWKEDLEKEKRGDIPCSKSSSLF